MNDIFHTPRNTIISDSKIFYMAGRYAIIFALIGLVGTLGGTFLTQNLNLHLTGKVNKTKEKIENIKPPEKEGCHADCCVNLH